MLKLKVFNSLVNSSYEFSFKLKGENGKKYINLIFAPNASGKSSFAKILDNHFNNIKTTNRFNGKESTVNIEQNDDKHDKVYRYDRYFSMNSAETFNKQLIISPKNAKEVVDLKNLINNEYTSLLDTYKRNSTYRQLKQYFNRFRVTDIRNIVKGSYSKSMNDATEIFNLLVKYTDFTLEDTSFKLDDFIDMSLNDMSFLLECIKFEEKIKTTIVENFPEIPDISKVDKEFYEYLIEYMSKNSTKILDKYCLMCGKTKMTAEIVSERLETLREQLQKYNDALQKSQMLNNLNLFTDQNYLSELFNNYKNDLLEHTGELLLTNIVKIGSELKELGFEDAMAKKYHYIVKLILDDKNIVNHIKNINDFSSKLMDVQSQNKAKINQNVVDRFKKVLRDLQFRYVDNIKIELSEENTIVMSAMDNSSNVNIKIDELFNQVLSESEKSIISFALFISLIDDFDKSIILIDDPIDSHDQKNKWFILSLIKEYFGNNNESMVIVLTHDLDVSKSFSFVDDKQINYEYYILTRKGAEKSIKSTLYFMHLYNFVYYLLDTCPVNQIGIYVFIIGFLSRYLSKNQFKIYNEVFFDTSLTEKDALTRQYTNELGFERISTEFVHYHQNINAIDIADSLIKLFRFKNYNSSVQLYRILPPYITTSIDSDLLIYNILNDLKSNSSYRNNDDLIKIMTALLIRNLIQKKIVTRDTSVIDNTLGKIVNNYLSKHPADDIINFYKRHKSMVDQFAHLDSGLDALLIYDIHDLSLVLNELENIS